MIVLYFYWTEVDLFWMKSSVIQCDGHFSIALPTLIFWHPVANMNQNFNLIYRIIIARLQIADLVLIR